ncbi:hypothetical protein SAMN05216267_1020140 [Actinacidiphila rubida]|uniref:Uncharacterized protein n=1 Tax=Actinacidiphila rubida TaxID=310780 RepID=A0A1H8N0U4_9ACTN|nr:hypothetical protein [Actinacidiphila rubida]SEO23190.1 hypothetical protein SAMN05216267_1020140 [Actinacidiphila rubida]
MADEFGPTTPAEPDPIDRRMRQLAREAEPLVVLAGPAAARRQGERRTRRRRAGAVGLAAALALGIGSWQLLPRLGADRAGTVPAATVPAPAPRPSVALAARLEAELLPPSALPLYPKRQWETLPAAVAAAKFPEPCPVAGYDVHPLAQARRVYRTPDGFVAYYRLYAMPSADDSATAVKSLDALIKGKCGWVASDGSGGTPGYGSWPASGSAGGSGGPGASSTVWVGRSGGYLAVLDVTGSDVKNGTVGGPWPGACISASLARLSGSAAGPDTHEPSVDVRSSPSASFHC